MSSASCCRQSLSSSISSWRWAGSAGRSAYICCWLRNGLTRAGCAAWRPICRTGSGSYVLGHRVAGGSRRGGRVRVATRARARLPAVRHRTAGPVQVRVRVGGGRRQAVKRESREESEPGAVYQRAGRWGPEGDNADGTAASRATANHTSSTRPQRPRHRVDRLNAAGPPAHQIWLPPLGAPEPLDRVIGALALSDERGLTTVDPRGWGRLRAPVAIVDRPFTQRRDALVVDLTGSAGHVAIVGGPQSGKSTLLRTLISALALTHTPREVTFYGLDFGGGALVALQELPHVGAVVGRHDADAVRRTVGEVAAVLAQREREHGAAAAAELRRQPRGLGAHGDLFLIVDGWGTLRSDYDDLEPLITDIAARGLSYGVHVVVTATRWADLRPALRDLLSTRLELRLGDPSESVVTRKAAASVPERTPGRGLVHDGAHFLTLTPSPDTPGQSRRLGHSNMRRAYGNCPPPSRSKTSAASKPMGSCCLSG